MLTTNRSFKALGLALALGAALTIHGTMLWGFEGVAAQAAASCAAESSKTANSQPAGMGSTVAPGGASGSSKTRTPT